MQSGTAVVGGVIDPVVRLNSFSDEDGTQMRSMKSILLEAQLFKSGPEFVYEWLRVQAESLKALGSFDKEAKQSLLARNHPLIDLALARFSDSPEVLRALFRRSSSWATSNTVAD